MDKIIITGGKKLRGDVKISGSKNAALPILIASILSDGKCSIHNVPHLRDIDTILAVLQAIGMRIERTSETVNTTPPDRFHSIAPYKLVKTMRASVLVLGALLARVGKAKVALPGGCAIGMRPVDIHLSGLEKLGVNIHIEKGYICAKARKLKGAHIYLNFPSVGATENLMLSAVLASGVTYIENAACEPEIIDLADFLNSMGAKVHGAGTRNIEIKGVKRLGQTQHKIIPDRIEAGTFLIAGAMVGGEIHIKDVIPSHLDSVITKLKEAGVLIKIRKNSLVVRGEDIYKPVNVETMTYPGFPTDMQAQLTAFMSVTPGTSVVTETIFENRFMHIGELNRLGANISIIGNSAVIEGVSNLSGAPLMATDLRASAALVLAGLVAEGETTISRVYHLDRGYDDIADKLSRLGANIKRVKE